MAGVQWKGGKCHGGTEAKAKMLHCDPEERLKHKHSNPHVGASDASRNFNFRGLDYAGMCAAYDARQSEIDQGKPGSGKNARTTMQLLCVYPPPGLAGDDAAIEAWMHDAGQLLADRYGSNLIEFSVHFDEKHRYFDKETKEYKISEPHGHAALIPEVDGKLNGKQFASRAEINALNKALHEMSIDKYHVPFMDGSKRKGGKTVENLKVQSEIAEMKHEAQQEAAAIIAGARAEAQTEAEAIAKAVKEETRREAEEIRAAAQREAAATRADAQRAAAAIRAAASREAEEIKAKARQDATAIRAAAQQEAEAIKAEAWRQQQAPAAAPPPPPPPKPKPQQQRGDDEIQKALGTYGGLNRQRNQWQRNGPGFPGK